MREQAKTNVFEYTAKGKGLNYGQTDYCRQKVDQTRIGAGDIFVVPMWQVENSAILRRIAQGDIVRTVGVYNRRMEAPLVLSVQTHSDAAIL